MVAQLAKKLPAFIEPEISLLQRRRTVAESKTA
jgi:hypothetical protein